jgi:uncharacterized Zn finger protein
VKKLIYNGLIFSLFITITLVAVSCAFNSSYFVGEGMEQGNKDFRESFIKVENKFSARGCKDDKCTIERVISSASAFVVSTSKTGSYAITAAQEARLY